MPWKQHRIFKSKLLAVLFLFFNCICTAAPVLKLRDENGTNVFASRTLQAPNPLDNDEETHASTSGYINHVHRISVRRHCDKLICESLAATSTVLYSGISLPNTHTPNDSILPTPGNAAFLFRYNLF
jgi:hypothetical protein